MPQRLQAHPLPNCFLGEDPTYLWHQNPFRKLYLGELILVTKQSIHKLLPNALNFLFYLQKLVHVHVNCALVLRNQKGTKCYHAFDYFRQFATISWNKSILACTEIKHDVKVLSLSHVPAAVERRNLYWWSQNYWVIWNWQREVVLEEVRQGLLQLSLWDVAQVKVVGLVGYLDHEEHQFWHHYFFTPESTKKLPQIGYIKLRQYCDCINNIGFGVPGLQWMHLLQIQRPSPPRLPFTVTRPDMGALWTEPCNTSTHRGKFKDTEIYWVYNYL